MLTAAVTLTSWGCADQRRASANGEEEAARRALHLYFDTFVAQDRAGLRQLTTNDFMLIENGYPINFDRLTETWDVNQPWTWKYTFENLAVTIAGDIALFQYDLRWREGEQTTFSGIETGFARRENGHWRLARFHGTWLARRNAPGDVLPDYVGTYGRIQTGYHIAIEQSALYAERIDRKPWSI